MSTPIIEPDMEATYSLEAVVELTGMSAQTILKYQQKGLLASLLDDDALRTLTRIEQLRVHYDMSEAALCLMVELMTEVEHLRQNLRCRR